MTTIDDYLDDEDFNDYEPESEDRINKRIDDYNRARDLQEPSWR